MIGEGDGMGGGAGDHYIRACLFLLSVAIVSVVLHADLPVLSLSHIMVAFSKIAAATTFAALASAQTYQRLGACPDLGCVFPPDQ